MKLEPTRRDFLGGSLALPLVLSSRGLRLPGGSAKKTLLVVGGTRFLGPAVVQAALERGYEVTLFNRGKSNPELFPELEKLVGDRDTGDLAALEGREWDVVVDTSAYLPAHARQMGRLLADHVGHYVMISTCSVYAPREGHEPVSEEDPVLRVPAEDVGKVERISDALRVGGGQYYGPLKALCEEEYEEALPGRFTSLRPGVIAGRDDPSDRLPYWVARVAQGGEVLAPEPKGLGVQFTDVRDLGIFSVEFAAQGKAGIFNSIGFPETLTMEALLAACREALGSDCSFTWVAEPFLLEKRVRPFVELPFWLPEDQAVTFANRKGIAAGMRFRPIAETIRETADWHFAERGNDHPWTVYGMRPEREAELLAAWHEASSAPEPK